MVHLLAFNYAKELSFVVLMMIIIILDMISKILYHLVIYTNAFTEKNIMFGIYFNPVVGEGREKWGDG